MRLVCQHCGSKALPSAVKCPNCGATDLQAAPSATGAQGGFQFRITGVAGFLKSCLIAPVVGLVCAGVFAYQVNSRVDSPAPSPHVAGQSAAGFAGLRARGSLKVGVDPDAPPFLSRTENGWEGFEYAVISAIGESGKVPVKIVAVPYDDLLGAVASGSVDIAVAQLPPQTRSGVSFSRSYLQYTLCLVTRTDDPAQRLADLRGRRIGLYKDPTAMAALGKGQFQERFYSDSGYFADLGAGEIDGVLYDCPLARHELRTDPAASLLRIVDDRVDVATYSIAVSERVPGLREEIDAVLGDLGTSGLFLPLASRWLGEAPPSEFQGAASRVTAVAAGEDLAAVAARAGVSADNLVRWNNDILGSGPPAVYGGMMLRVR